MYNITCFGVINIWSMAAGGQISTHAKYGQWGQKTVFTFLNFWTTKNNQNIALDNLCTRTYNIEYLPPSLIF